MTIKQALELVLRRGVAPVVKVGDVVNVWRYTMTRIDGQIVTDYIHQEVTVIDIVSNPYRIFSVDPVENVAYVRGLGLFGEFLDYAVLLPDGTLLSLDLYYQLVWAKSEVGAA